MKQKIYASKAPAAGGPYSQGVKSSSRIYVTGQRSVDAVTNAIPASFAEQARLWLQNVQHVLEAGGRNLGRCGRRKCVSGGYQLFCGI